MDHLLLFRCVLLPEVNFRDKIEALSSYFQAAQVSIAAEGICLLTTHNQSAMVFYRIPNLLCRTLYIAPELQQEIIRLQTSLTQWWNVLKNCKKKTNLLYAISMKQNDSNHLYLEYVNAVTNEVQPNPEPIDVIWNPHLDRSSIFNQGQEIPDPSAYERKLPIFPVAFKQCLSYLSLFSVMLEIVFCAHGIHLIAQEKQSNEPSIPVLLQQTRSISAYGSAHAWVYKASPGQSATAKPVMAQSQENQEDVQRSVGEKSLVEESDFPAQRVWLHDIQLLYKTKFLPNESKFIVHTKLQSPVLFTMETENGEQFFYYVSLLPA